MNYKEQIDQAKRAAEKWKSENPIVGVGRLRVDLMVDDLCRSITDLLSRTEAAEARCALLDKARENANEACAKWEGMYRMALERAEKAENELFRMKSILSFPKLYEREGAIYPIKNTTKKQVYKAMLDAQKEVGIYGRCFYDLIKEE